MDTVHQLRDNRRCLLYVLLDEQSHLVAEVSLHDVQIAHGQRQTLSICNGLHGEFPEIHFGSLHLLSYILLAHV